VPPLEQGFMGISERDLRSEGYWGKAGETVNGIEVRTSEESITDYSNLRSKDLMPGEAARWGEGDDGKLHGVLKVKAGNQLMGGGGGSGSDLRTRNVHTRN
jgi:hypothetical protein